MTLKKFKVKEKFEKIKAQLEAQKDNIPPQTQLTVSMLIQLVEIIIVAFEERFTKKNSRNSSIPPSKSREKKTFLALPRANLKWQLDSRHLEKLVQ